jgi:hypothetical protein
VQTKRHLNLFKTYKKPQPQKDGPRERFLRGEATHRRNKTPTENSVSFDKVGYLYDLIGIKCA